MALGTFIAGRYSGSYNGGDIGITEQGFTLSLTPHAERIAESDAYGQTLIELIFRGCDVGLILDSLEYKTASIASIWPWGSLGTMGVIGRLGSALAQSVILTAAAGTPAASTPATATFGRSLLSPGFNVNLLFNSKLRKVPIRYDVLPSDSAIHFTTT